MVIIRNMNETLTNSMGDRITYCRSALGLTRKELAERWGGASVPSIARWELDTVKIPEKKLLAMICFFFDCGLVITEEWIISGTGTPPLLIKNDLFKDLDFDSLAQENLLNINMQQKGFIFGQVRNNLVSPVIKYGDYIGGISSFNCLNKDIAKSFTDELIFIKKKTGLLVGIFKDIQQEIIIRNFAGASEVVNSDNLEAVGRVQWIVRRS